MSLEIREPSDEELADLAFVVAYSFVGDRSPEGLEGTRRLFRLVQPLAAFAEGKLVAGLGILPLAMAPNGGALPFGGITTVACLPEHRRKGYVGKLLGRALEVMRERGQVLSGLYTYHFGLYRRYGWMVASRVLHCSFAPKDIVLVPPPKAGPRGESLRIGREEWSALDGIYERFISQRNGYLHRSEHWWRAGVFRSPYERMPQPRDAAVWAGDDGEWRGYVVYSLHHGPDEETQLQIRDFVALDSDAYLGLVQYILRHDSATEIVWNIPVDDPFLSLVDDPRRVQVQMWPTMMLRVVDVAQAIGGRPCLVEAPGERLVIEVGDAAAPWNQGVWRLEAEEGRVEVKRTDEAPQLSSDVTVLAALFNGFMTASEAARSGLLSVHSESALRAADRIFASRCPPFCADWF